MFKSGYVSVIGRSNVGKSTLLNKIMSMKLTIISNKAQTTRDKIQLIYTDEDCQIVFLDTPGIQTPKNQLGKIMLKMSLDSIKESDLVVYIVDTSMEIGRIDTEIINDLAKIKQDIILVINKSDRVTKEQLDQIIKMYEDKNLFSKIISISALKDENLDGLIDIIKSMLPEGPKYYNEDTVTTQSIRKISSEIIREKALNNLRDEIPHGIAVEINQFKKRKDKNNIYDIDATIYVEKKSHKGMVIGKNGAMLKKIGIQAREDIENLLESRVYLKLWVKIGADWRNKDYYLKSLGYKG